MTPRLGVLGCLLLTWVTATEAWVPLATFEAAEETAWTGLRRDVSRPREGLAAGRWDSKTTATIASAAIPADWSPFDQLVLWTASADGTATAVTVVVECAAQPPQAAAYFYRELLIERFEWTRLALPLLSFEGAGEPDWRRVRRLVLSTEWHGRHAPGGTLLLDDLRLERQPLAARDLGWFAVPGATAVERRWQLSGSAAAAPELPAALVGQVPPWLTVKPPSWQRFAGGQQAGWQISVTVQPATSGQDLAHRLWPLAAVAPRGGDPALQIGLAPDQSLRLPLELPSLAWFWNRPTARPWVRYTTAEVDRLQRLRELPTCRPAWTQTRLAAEAVQARLRQPANRGSHLPLEPAALATVLRLRAVDRSPAWDRLAVSLLGELTGQTDWVWPPHRPRIFDLRAATMGCTVAAGFDVLAARLDTPVRARAVAALVRQVCEPYEVLRSYGRFPTREPRNNWCAVLTSAAVVAAAALLGEDPRAPLWLQRSLTALRAVLEAQAADGGWGEGVAYWQYSLEALAAAALAVGNASQGQLDLWQHPFWHRTCDFATQTWLPPDSFVPFGDCLHRSRATGLLQRIAASADRPDCLALLQAQEATVTVADLDHRPPAPVPAAPPPGPLATAFGEIGWVVMRSSWDPTACVLAIRSGPANPHTHLDDNSFLLHVNGETLAAEPPTGRYPAGYFTPAGKAAALWSTTHGHSTLVVNDSPQLGEAGGGGSIRQFVYGGPGPDLAAAAGVGCDYLLADATATYPTPVECALRQVIYLRGRTAQPGDLGYFVMVDTVRTTRPARLDWRLQPGGPVAVDRTWSLVQGQRAALAVAPVWPDALRVRLARHDRGGEYLSVGPTAAVSALLQVTVLVPLRRPPSGGPPDLPGLTALPEGAGCRLLVQHGRALDHLTVTPAANRPAGITVVGTNASGAVERLALFHTARLHWGQRCLAEGTAIGGATVWSNGRDVSGRYVAAEPPGPLRIAVPTAPLDRPGTLEWSAADGMVTILPAARGPRAFSLAQCGGLP